MKRDARIGLAVVLVVGLAITLLVARSIHQNGAQAGIDQDPEPQRETASSKDGMTTDSGATMDPAYDAQAQALTEFQTQHNYRPGPTDISSGSPGEAADALLRNSNGMAQNAVDRNRMPPPSGGQNLMNNGGLPLLGQPPFPPTGAGQVQQQPVSNSLGMYTITAGDSPYKIAAKVFGDGKYAQKIMDANSGLNPNKLRVGQKITIPAIPNAKPRIALENTAGSTPIAQPTPLGGQNMAQDYYTGTGAVPPAGNPIIGNTPAPTAQTHTIAAGDTLGKIAAKYLGSSGPKALKKLTDANPGLDARKLKVGQEIRIPTP